jgi:hypothetical protein
MNASFKTSITVKTLGNPKHLLGEHHMREGDKRLLGTIIGEARNLIKRENPKDPENPHIGIGGKFEAINTDDDGLITGMVTSAVLFAPNVIHDSIVDKLASIGKGGVVKFAFQAFVVAGGTAGFTWEYRFLGDEGQPDENDTLAEQRALLLGAVKKKAIAGPRKLKSVE